MGIINIWSEKQLYRCIILYLRVLINIKQLIVNSIICYLFITDIANIKSYTKGLLPVDVWYLIR